MLYTPGHSFYAAWLAEVGPITENGASDPTQASVPGGTPNFIGQINPADILDDDGDEKGFSAGSQIAIYDQTRGRTYESTLTIRTQQTEFIDRCLPASLGATLPTSALFYGSTTAAAVYRQSVCNQLSGELSEGSGSELSLTAQMWSIYKDTATIALPTASDYVAMGAPYTWHDLSNFTIGGTNYRQELAGYSFTQNHNLERKGFRPEYVTSTKLARTTYALLAHHINGEGELRFHSPIKTTTNIWGDMVATVGTSTWTWYNVRPQQRRQPGVESSAQLGFTVPFKFDYMLVS